MADFPLLPSAPFNPVEIVHLVLTMRMDNKTVTFGVQAPQPPPTATWLRDIKGYAVDVAGRVAGLPNPNPVTPYDIEVLHQCWVLIELDRDINWRFQPNGFGCTTKAKGDDSGRGDNFGLHHVYPDGTIYLPGDKLPPDTAQDIANGDHRARCKVLYFGLAKRAPWESQYINLHVEFLEQDGTLRTMPIIFDPDVKNEGGFPIPPDEPIVPAKRP